jgi:D-alanyl-D-alanine dipeptidase
MVMKLFAKFSLVTSAVFVIALQSCGVSGNNASVSATSPVVVKEATTYLADVQKDSSKRMVSLTKYLQPLFKDFKYETEQNFTKKVLYHNPEAFLRLPAARALQAVQAELKQQNLALKIYDAYRPYSVTIEMWKAVPDERYAANPAKGSGHNRGVAVDVTLVDLATGNEIPMPSAFDDFSERAHHSYMKLDSVIIANRLLLRKTMEKHGFIALETEWWHYYLANPTRFELLDLSFEQLKSLEK